MVIVSVFKDFFSPSRPLASRLWRASGLIAAFIGTLLVGNMLIPPSRAVTWDMLGHDFLAFYYGGTCALTGHYEQLYDLPSTKAFEFKTGTAAGLSLGTSFGPWWNPPFAAWLFEPFARFPYMQALHLWWTLSAICLAFSCLLLTTMLEGSWKIRLLVPAIILLSMPCFQAFCHGQNSFLSLLLVTSTVWLWRNHLPLAAGLIAGLLFYKPQLGAVVAAVLCLHQGRRAILGVGITGTALVLLNVLLMPGSLHEFAFHVPLNLHWIQEENPYRWERHVTLKAFWRLVVQGDAVGVTEPATRALWLASELALGAALSLVALRSLLHRQSPSHRDQLIAAAIAAMPLLMPFYFDYDLLLMAVPIVVYAADRQRQISFGHAADWEDRALVIVWSAIFLVLMLWKTRMNPLVPLLALAAVLLIRRALRPSTIAGQIENPQPLPTALAA